MKNVNYFCKLTCIFIFTTLLSSCNEEKQHEFSHDATIDSWIIDNRQEILNYERNNIVTFSTKKQKAILNALPPKSRKKNMEE